MGSQRFKLNVLKNIINLIDNKKIRFSVTRSRKYAFVGQIPIQRSSYIIIIVGLFDTVTGIRDIS